MRTSHLLVASVSSFLAATTVASGQTADVDEPYLIISTRESNNGRGGTSFDRDTILISRRQSDERGTEVTYDLPPSASAAERAASWHFPAAIRFAPDGSRVLVNEAELASRVDPWLKLGGYTREACGHWIFTWNAFKIDCDPLSVLETASEFDMGPTDPQDGQPIRNEAASAPGTLKLVKSQGSSRTYTVEFELDPERVMQSRAESDVVVGQIVNKPITLETALAAHRNESISGQITERFETDGTGQIVRRTTETTIRSIDNDGKESVATSTRTLEKHTLKSANETT